MTISAKIIADSIYNGNRITTFELEYPRFIHAEFLTHRLFSRNAASSRAIPIAKAIELIESDTAMPIHWGKNKAGMSANAECTDYVQLEEYENCADIASIEPIFHRTLRSRSRQFTWFAARDAAITYAKAFAYTGYHKQIVNRLLEPFTHIKVVVTSTEYDNFFWLRDHKDAQPEIAELAKVMKLAYNASKTITLPHGAWHLPYYYDGYWGASNIGNPTFDKYGHTLDEAIAISSSCCAQVSYRKTDSTLEKAIAIYDRLVGGMPPHFSPFEHQATPIVDGATFETDENITHIDREGNAWCGNFKNWVQYRQVLMKKLKISPMTSKPPKELMR